VTLTLVHPDPKATIRYAFDGNVPTRHSPVYDKPLKISETRIVKARAWHPVYAPSKVAQAVMADSNNQRNRTAPEDFVGGSVVEALSGSQV
jgi:hypothetical protein